MNKSWPGRQSSNIVNGQLSVVGRTLDLSGPLFPSLLNEGPGSKSLINSSPSITTVTATLQVEAVRGRYKKYLVQLSHQNLIGWLPYMGHKRQYEDPPQREEWAFYTLRLKNSLKSSVSPPRTDDVWLQVSCGLWGPSWDLCVLHAAAILARHPWLLDGVDSLPLLSFSSEHHLLLSTSIQRRQ